MLEDVRIKGFRSVKELQLPLRRLTVLTGANGVGKTNIYRALQLLHCAANGTLADEIAREGGLGSVFWAGGTNLTEDGHFDPKHRTDGYRKGEKRRIELGATLELNGLTARYAVELGFPSPYDAAFSGESQVKHEHLDLVVDRRTSRALEREGGAAWIRGEGGERQEVDERLMASETGLSLLRASPEISAVRETLANWRFFHGFRTDRDSPLRRPAQALTSPLLASDGANLAAVFATLRHIRHESRDLDEIIELAFPGSELVVPTPGDYASFGMIFPETPKRTFWAHELSDGTLQLLALLGALLSYRLPPFIALNEPETSLHPSLLPALARTIIKAAAHAQVWVVTHSEPLAESIAEQSGAVPREVIRTENGTAIRGLSRLGVFDERSE
jgi:predicted ATPase